MKFRYRRSRATWRAMRRPTKQLLAGTAALAVLLALTPFVGSLPVLLTLVVSVDAALLVVLLLLSLRAPTGRIEPVSAPATLL